MPHLLEMQSGAVDYLYDLTGTVVVDMDLEKSDVRDNEPDPAVSLAFYGRIQAVTGM